jgi:hypothetical protein
MKIAAAADAKARQRFTNDGGDMADSVRVKMRRRATTLS